MTQNMVESHFQADVSVHGKKILFGMAFAPTVCLLMICKGFQGISSQPDVIATWGFTVNLRIKIVTFNFFAPNDLSGDLDL